MKKKILLPFFIIITFSISVAGYMYQNNNLPNDRIYQFIGEETLAKEGTIVIHKEKVDKGMVLFFTNREQSYNVKVRFVKRNIFDWETTNDGANFNWGPKETYHGPEDYYFPTSYNEDQSPFPMIMGTVQNPKIKNIEITYEYDEKKKIVNAKTINKEGRHIYFAFLDKPKSPNTYNIIGYDANGNIIDEKKEKAHFPSS